MPLSIFFTLCIFSAAVICTVFALAAHTHKQESIRWSNERARHPLRAADAPQIEGLAEALQAACHDHNAEMDQSLRGPLSRPRVRAPLLGTLAHHEALSRSVCTMKARPYTLHV